MKINSLATNYGNTRVISEGLSKANNVIENINPLDDNAAFNQKEELLKTVDMSIQGIRFNAESQTFKTTMIDHHNPLATTYQSLKDYMGELIDQHPRLQILETNLCYIKEEHPCDEDEMSHKCFCAQIDREDLFDHIESSELSDLMAGYIWQLGYSHEKGFQCHMVFFFHESAERPIIDIIKMIDHYWITTITEGRGRSEHLNCSVNKNIYNSTGITVINYDDTEQRDRLKKIVANLIMIDDSANFFALDKSGITFGIREENPKARDNSSSRIVAYFNFTESIPYIS